MPPSITLPRTAPNRQRPALAPYVAAGAFVAVVVLLLPVLLHARSHVARLDVTNESPYGVAVEGVDAGGDRTPIGSLGPRSRATFREVADLGGSWVLRFRSGGAMVDLPFTRDELGQADWSVLVPDELVEQLAQEGAPIAP